jgi:hypothetical protein
MEEEVKVGQKRHLDETAEQPNPKKQKISFAGSLTRTGTIVDSTTAIDYASSSSSQSTESELKSQLLQRKLSTALRISKGSSVQEGIAEISEISAELSQGQQQQLARTLGSILQPQDEPEEEDSTQSKTSAVKVFVAGGYFEDDEFAPQPDHGEEEERPVDFGEEDNEERVQAEELPVEIWILIFEHLEDKHKMALALCSKRLLQIFRQWVGFDYQSVLSIEGLQFFASNGDPEKPYSGFVETEEGKRRGTIATSHFSWVFTEEVKSYLFTKQERKNISPPHWKNDSGKHSDKVLTLFHPSEQATADLKNSSSYGYSFEPSATFKWYSHPDGLKMLGCIPLRDWNIHLFPADFLPSYPIKSVWARLLLGDFPHVHKRVGWPSTYEEVKRKKLDGTFLKVEYLLHTVVEDPDKDIPSADLHIQLNMRALKRHIERDGDVSSPLIRNGSPI